MQGHYVGHIFRKKTRGKDPKALVACSRVGDGENMNFRWFQPNINKSVSQFESYWSPMCRETNVNFWHQFLTQSASIKEWWHQPIRIYQYSRGSCRSDLFVSSFIILYFTSHFLNFSTPCCLTFEIDSFFFHRLPNLSVLMSWFPYPHRADIRDAGPIC